MNLLKSRRFLPLFITQFFGAFNDNVFKNAFVIWLTYSVANNLNMNVQMMVTIAFALFILPFFLFSTIAGQVADKYEKSQLVCFVKISEIVIMSGVFFGFYLQNIYVLLFLLFLMGVQSTFFGPLKYSLLPSHLKDEELVQGNGLIESGTFLAILLGTIFGGILIQFEYGIEIISLSIMCFSVMGYVSARYIPEAHINDKESQISFNIISQTAKIFHYSKQEYSVWLAMIGISWFWFVGSVFLSQFSIYTKDIIRADENVVILFLCIFSIGIAIGSMVCSKLIKNKIDGRLVPFGSIGITIGILIFCAASKIYQPVGGVEDFLTLGEFILGGISNLAIMFGLLVIAICSGIYIVPLYAIMQHRSDEKYLSRIIAANNIMNAFFMVVSGLFIILFIAIGVSLIQIFFAVGMINIFVFFTIRKIVQRRLT